MLVNSIVELFVRDILDVRDLKRICNIWQSIKELRAHHITTITGHVHRALIH